MRILATGGGGFVGSEFVRSVLLGTLPCSANSHVTVLDSADRLGNLADVADHPRFRFVPGDLRDADAVEDALSGQNLIVQFARATVFGTQVLLEAARRHRIGRFIHVSADGPSAAEKVALTWQRNHCLDVVITRRANGYGHRQHPDELIPKAITSLLDGRPLPRFGSGGLAWAHVSDLCRGIALVLLFGRTGEVYDIAGTWLSHVDLATRLHAAIRGEATDPRPVLRPVDATKMAEELGYQPRVGIDEGLAATVEWYRANRSWWQPPKPSSVAA
jgi:dTDP-glucose 4,6-dehydratase